MLLDLLSKQAKLIVNYSVGVQKGESVMIEGFVEAIPLIKEIFREVIRVGGHPTIKINLPEQEEIFYKEAQEHQIQYSDPLKLYYVQNLDVMIRILGESKNTGKFIDRVNKNKLAQKEAWKVLFQRLREEKLRVTVTYFPSESIRQLTRMSKKKFALLFEKACLLHKEKPIAEWQSVSIKQQKYCDYLEKIDVLHLVGKGTDLAMSIKGRKWGKGDGKINMPDGEIYTSPIENSINGTITFAFPIVYFGKEIKNLTLKFKKGRVFKARVEKGQEVINKIIKMSGAKRVGEIGIGTNYDIRQFIKEPFFLEKVGGTIHLALGHSVPNTGGKNFSSVHLDFVCDMREKGQIYADEDLIYESGKFLF